MSKKVAVCQMTSIADKAANLQVVSNLVSDAAKEGVQMVFFPEACDYISGDRNETVEWAEPILGGPTVNAYRELASKHKDVSATGKIFNTHIIINSEGDIVQTYRKLHLFDVEIPEKNVRLMESDFTNAGTHIVAPMDCPVGKIGRSCVYSLYCLSLRKGMIDCHKCEPKEGLSDPSQRQSDPSQGPTDATSDGCLAFGHCRIPESLMTCRCVTPGHVLVAPLRAAERKQHLTDDESDDFYRTIRLIQRVLMTWRCVTPGHVLVAPLRAAKRNQHLTDDESEDFYRTIRLIQRHLHCHIMPRKKGDFIDNDLIYLELAKHDQYVLI
ncbi:Nitrilase and fragile histidine triad fusion protein NitFhit [Operophtera brumata]|uniref:Nitrilase and fragile histidine triad fusion protein NitFhit n=1 Tax=Operophtera brumata TaxID=104452 RepID=A0A0L7KPY0_OPEBR|nr:Nitrilase and fragile histidine triad fusion protein NitFhit [Operophtera brumata]